MLFMTGQPPAIYPALDPQAMLDAEEASIAIMYRDPDTGEVSKLTSFTPKQARFVGTLMQGLASEAQTQYAYQAALRSHKNTEEEIREIMTDAAKVIVAMRHEL